ncbi:MAG: hypothetical protein GY929_17725 [Actinomycetia bacterium]|nr:hypothetical protein [Actinomycetes bacterium]
MSRTEGPPSMGRRTMAVVLVLLGLAALSGPIILALRADRGQAAFGDAEVVGVNRLTSATVDVEPGERTATMTVTNMAPGDRAFGSIEVVNEGTLPLRYLLTSVASPSPLNPWLQWSIWPPDQSMGCDTLPDSSTLIVDGRVLDGSASSTVFGSLEPGLDPGDRILQPADTEELCVSVELRLEAPDSVQGQTLDQEFVIHAEQHTEDLP